MGPRVEALINAAPPKVRLLRINLKGGWRVPVASQYGIRALPQLWLYEGRDRLTTNTQEVLRHLEEAGQ